MRLYKSRWVQPSLAVLYAIIMFGLLRGWNSINPWIDVIAILLFCSLWGNVKYVLLSTALMFAVSVPLWWFVVFKGTSYAIDIEGWYPLIIFNFLIYVLVPEILLVLGRNVVLRRLLRKPEKA